MKKILVISLIALVVFSMVAYADTEKNPIVEKLQEVKEVLLSILDKLGIIADKETTVIVEPNITVIPPEVNVEAPIVNINPNITVQAPDVNVYPDVNVTLPEKECKWENLTLRVDINQDNIDQIQSDLFTLPSNKGFNEIKINKVVGIIKCMSSIECEYKVNGQRCYYTRETQSYKRSVDFCTDKFKSGVNIVTIEAF